jgi:secondary thiamine-phosphate synthase enzyme
MITKVGTLSVQTQGRHDLQNITAEVDGVIADTGISTGICLVSVPHTTCAITVNEDEQGLVEDLLRMAVELLAPIKARKPFQHDRIDNNAQAHLTSSIFGCSVMLPIREGGLHLGSWQNLFLVDCDGPRTRRIEITALGD